MTEDEAKTKWCPMVRPSSVAMKDLRDAHEMRCIGTECMAWRWFKGENVFTGIEDDKPVYEKRDQRPGGCGLAGIPIIVL